MVRGHQEVRQGLTCLHRRRTQERHPGPGGGGHGLEPGPCPPTATSPANSSIGPRHRHGGGDRQTQDKTVQVLPLMPARSLQTVWVTSGSLCGTVSGLVHEQLVGTDGSRGVPGPGLGQVQHRGPCRTRVHVGRYLAPVKARTPIRGRATTRPGSLLRNSITIHKAGDEVETEPGFFEIDTEAYSWGVGEDESGDGLYCGFKSVVGAAVIHVENTPGLEVRDDSFDEVADTIDGRVVSSILFC